MKIGFIGCGNMGKAMLKGMLDANLVSESDVLVATHTQTSADAIHTQYKVATICDNKEVAKQCEYIILAMKPYLFEAVIETIKLEAKDKVIISVAAGVSIAKIQTFFDCDTLKVVRTMPNTPASVLMAMSSLSFNPFMQEDEKRFVIALFESFGECVVVAEDMIHAIIGISGSSPAYAFMFLDAMIQNGIKHGLDKKMATKLASQSLMGAAKMVATIEEDADQLKQNVCSPNGTTIEAVHVLEAKQFKESIDEAMDACIARSKEMSK